MNTIAANFGYIATPWWNLDFDQAINYYAEDVIKQYLQQVHQKSVSNILKSHHPVGFFGEIIDYLTEQFHVVYIYRDPRDVLISYWKLIRAYSWDVGPRTNTPGEFFRSEPSGAMLRYQKRQERNVLQRWRTHVKGWIDMAENASDVGIILVRYEELNLNFEETVRKLSEQLKLPHSKINRPDNVTSVIAKGEGLVGGYRNYLDSDDNKFIYSEIGDLMDRLKYSR